MNDLVKKLRDYSYDGDGWQLQQKAADEIERLRTENAEMRAERDAIHRQARSISGAYDMAEATITKLEQERDALAATIRELDAICTPVMRAHAGPTRTNDFNAAMDSSYIMARNILADRDARVKAEALLRGADVVYCDSCANELRRMADAIEKGGQS